MFTREEASRIKAEFWTTFGRYMKPVLSAEGLKVNWINYNTGLKDVYFRMDAGAKSARVSIAIEHGDLGIQELFFEQFEELKMLLHSTLEEEWDWQMHVPNGHHRVISSISKDLNSVSVFNHEHWSDLISFFKPRMIALDDFWENGKYAFDALR